MTKSIRFIDSQYHDLFRIPDGGMIQVTYPDRSFAAKCEYVDDYHLKVANELFHICQFAEILERGGGSCQPEPIAIKSERVSELGTKISDLSSLSKNLSFGANHIFYTRAHDGYDGLTATYDLDFKEALKMDSSLLYEAVDNGDLDVIIVFSTDSLLRKFDLTCLEDDRALFPPYEGVAVCRNEAIEKHQELKEILNMLTYAFNDNIIQDLNYQVDIEKRSIEEAAAEFLKDNGYLD